jgi:hypothetical protein
MRSPVPNTRRLPVTSRNASSIEMRSQDLHHLSRDARVLLHVRTHVDAVRARLPGLRDRHRAADAEAARLVGCGGDDAPAAALAGIGAYDDRAAAQLGPVALLDRGVERVHVHVEDGPGWRHSCILAQGWAERVR